MLTIMYREPRSSGSQRQRSMFIAICSTMAASPCLPGQRELMLQTLILGRLRRQIAQRRFDQVLAERGIERVVQIDVLRGGVPVRIDVFRIDGAVRQIPGVAQVRVGGPQVEVDRLVGSSCRNGVPRSASNSSTW